MATAVAATRSLLFPVRGGGALFGLVTHIVAPEYKVSADKRPRYEHKPEVDGQAFDDCHGVASQIEHGKVENGVCHFIYDNKNEIGEEVEQQQTE